MDSGSIRQESCSPSPRAGASRRLPDFIIGGAPKCGTTSLRGILDKHPTIFMAKDEIYFFDFDDPTFHREAFPHFAKGWPFHNLERNLDGYINWYASWFSAAPEGALLGEDSTTYLFSPKTPERIARILPGAKLLFMLRDPVGRAYSHYWQMVRTGRTFMGFENTLARHPHEVIEPGYYRRHLERFYRWIPPERIKVVVFEQFVSQMQDVVDDVCRFLGVQSNLDVAQLRSHFNATAVPKPLTAKLAVNWLRLLSPSTLLTCHLPGMQHPYRHMSPQQVAAHATAAAADRLVDLLPKQQVRPMRRETREFLQKLYTRENAGLNDVVGFDATSRWSIGES